MNSEKGSIILLTVISVATLLVAVAGATFAYFSATMPGSESQKVIEVTSGTLGVEYETNSKIDAGNLNLGDVVAVKKFTATGVITGSESLNYQAILNVKNNTYAEGELVYTISSKNTANNGQTIKATSKPVAIPQGASTIDLGSGFFTGPTTTGSIHEYTITITYASAVGDPTIARAFSAQMSVSQTKK